MKKRILFIFCYLKIGGTERVLMNMFNRFDYSRFDVELLLLYNEGILLQDLPKEIKVRYLYSHQLSLGEKINFNLLSRFGIELGYKVLINSKIGRYDTIVSFYSGMPLKYHTYITKRANKNISWVHTDLLTNHESVGCGFTIAEEKEAYRKMDKIVFVSNDAKNQFKKLYTDIETSKEVIFNPIESEFITQYRKEFRKYSSNRSFNIVAVGRLHPIKGFDRLIRLAKRLKGEGYKLNIKIIGDGDLYKSLSDLIVENEVEDNVFLRGGLKNPYEEMSNADLLVSTSLAEGFSLVVGEAFCLGLPVVSTKTTGPIELLFNSKYGLLTDHDDESIYQAVKKMIDDDVLREYYHRKSLERAAILDIDSVMNQIYNIL